jgi:DNA-binding NarL/FixJ family response regulator
MSNQLSTPKTSNSTPIQRRILRDLCRGLAIDQIAERRAYSPTTVRRELRALQRNLNCKSREELIYACIYNQIIKEDLGDTAHGFSLE